MTYVKLKHISFLFLFFPSFGKIRHTVEVRLQYHQIHNIIKGEIVPSELYGGPKSEHPKLGEPIR